MSVLEQLLGGSQARQQDYQDFVQRYQQGAPHEGINDNEAVQRYQEVAQQLPPEQYQQSAEEAFARLTPSQRAEFGQWLAQRAQQSGVVPADARSGDMNDPRQLAQVATRMHQQQPGLLGGLLGGMLGGGGSGGSGALSGGRGTGGALSSPIAKAALAGITAMAAQRIMGRRR